MVTKLEGQSDRESETSLVLLERVRAGDAVALNVLLTRYLPRLRRWATGRIPPGFRGVTDTDDLVQDTLIGAVRNLGRFEPRGEGALLAYLLEALRNRLRDEFRRGRVRPEFSQLDETLASHAPSPLDALLDGRTIDRYERALSTLSAERREAIIARFELGYSHAEVARLLGKSGADAARKLTTRAVLELADAMNRDE